MSRQKIAMGPGASSLILIAVVLALSVLTVLTMISARNDEALSLRGEETRTEIYELFARGELGSLPPCDLIFAEMPFFLQPAASDREGAPHGENGVEASFVAVFEQERDLERAVGIFLSARADGRVQPPLQLGVEQPRQFLQLIRTAENLLRQLFPVDAPPVRRDRVAPPCLDDPRKHVSSRIGADVVTDGVRVENAPAEA